VTGPRVLLLTLSERTSGKGNRYLSGWLGKASVVAFAGEPDRHGNPTWDLFVSEPQPRAEAGAKSAKLADLERGPARRPQVKSASFAGSVPGGGVTVPGGQSSPPAKPSASPVARGDGWRGSQYRRPANGAQRAPAAGGAFAEDGVDDLYR
jgi:hypothetical protein